MIIERARSAFAKAENIVFDGAKWIWCHRTKTLGTIGVGASYVIDHQEKLGLFVSAKNVTHLLGYFGAAAFCIGIFNTLFPPQPKP
jgi:hypothetical protein